MMACPDNNDDEEDVVAILSVWCITGIKFLSPEQTSHNAVNNTTGCIAKVLPSLPPETSGQLMCCGRVVEVVLD